MTQAAIGVVLLAAIALAMPDDGAPLSMFKAAVAQPRQGGEAAAGDKERQFKMAIYWATGCKGVTRVAGIDGQTDAQIAKLLGEPERKETFRLGERPDEFHITLQNHYPLKNAANGNVPVQEWTWSKDKCKLTVWLHKPGEDWVGLENIRYTADAEF